MPSRRHRRQQPDPDRLWRTAIILMGLAIVGASFVLYAINGGASSIIVGAGVGLVGIGVSPKVAQLLVPGGYEMPPRELPEHRYGPRKDLEDEDEWEGEDHHHPPPSPSPTPPAPSPSPPFNRDREPL